MKKLRLLALAAIAFAGCSTTGSSSKFYEDSGGILAASRIEVRNVSVVVDYVRQNDIESQVLDIAGSLIEGSGVAELTLYADIDVNQRSFIDGIDPKNSLFVTLVIETEDGRIIARQHAYAVGNETVISSAVQRKYLARLVENVTRERIREARTAKK